MYCALGRYGFNYRSLWFYRFQWQLQPHCSYPEAICCYCLSERLFFCIKDFEYMDRLFPVRQVFRSHGKTWVNFRKCNEFVRPAGFRCNRFLQRRHYHDGFHRKICVI